MTWQDRLAIASFAVAILGLVATLVGFAIAIYQVVKTRSETSAAQKAVTRTVDHLAANQVLVFLAQLQAIESELDNAVHEKDHRAAERVIVRWRQLSSQVRGVLARGDWASDRLLQKMQASGVVAADAKERLLVANSDVAIATRDIRASIQAVSDDLGVLIAELSIRVTSEVSGG